jgi:hypothetical protein
MRTFDVSANAARQLELFPLRARRKPFTPERLTSVALGVWGASKPIAGTLGARLFYDLRTDVPGHVARFCANLKRGEARAPGVVFLLRDLRSGQPCGLVRLYLDSDGRVFDRRILGRAVGATVMPRPP